MSLEYLRCKLCGGPMMCMQSLAYHLNERCQSEEHKAKQKEYDDGIIHDWRCKLEMIDIPKLVLKIDVPDLVLKVD